MYVALLLLILYCPILVLMINSFNLSKYSVNWAGFTLDWYKNILQNKALIQASINSIKVSITSATIATIIGGLSAISFLKYNYFGKKFLKSSLYITLVIPDIILGISFLTLFVLLKVKLGFVSLLISHIALSLPFVVITILIRLNNFNINIIEAAKDLGAGDFCIFLKIILPLIFPSILSAWIIAFTLSFDDVIISYFVSGPSYDILPLLIFSMAKIGAKPEVNAVCTIILCFSILFVIISQLLLIKKK